jgi:hypothetical protein
MIRRFTSLLAVSGLVVLAAAVPSQAATTLRATVGPGNSISLKTSSGSSVRSLTSGTYTIVVNDRSRFHNFHLIGPVNTLNRSTTTRFVGKQTWRMRFVKGTYRFVCDRHMRTMKGSSTVR